MSPVHVGTILVEDLPLMTQTMQLETEPFSGNWRMVKYCDSFTLDRKIRAAGWNFFFMAARVQVMFLGPIRSNKLKDALKRLLKKTKQENFNGLEVTEITTKHFLRIPYTIVSAHSCHIQRENGLESVAKRHAFHKAAAWARD